MAAAMPSHVRVRRKPVPLPRTKILKTPITNFEDLRIYENYPLLSTSTPKLSYDASGEEEDVTEDTGDSGIAEWTGGKSPLVSA